jgi:hypothetical protein
VTSGAVSETLTGLIGKRIASIRRLLYVFAGKVDSDIGPVELTLSDGSIFLFNVGSDGASLRVDEEGWQDPFEEPLSPENREFVERSGKWTAFDVSSKQPYNALIDRTVVDVQPIMGQLHKIVGAGIITDIGTLRVTIAFDEVLVAVT